MKYDYNKVSREALEKLAVESCRYVESAGDYTAYQQARATVMDQAQVRTRAEYDREIGDMLRLKLSPEARGYLALQDDTSNKLRALVNASRNAPEE